MKKAITFILTAAIIAASAGAYAYSNNIADSSKEYNILEGDENGDLKLDSYVTRAEMTKIICTVMREKASSDASELTDISSHWAKDYITTAEKLGLVNGFEDKSFRPDESVTYEQAIKIILGEFRSANYPKDYVAFALDNGLLENVGSIIGENITRGDVAQIITNLIDALKDNAISDYILYPGVKKLAEYYMPETTAEDIPIYSSMSIGSSGGGSSASSSITHPTPHLGAVNEGGAYSPEACPIMPDEAADSSSAIFPYSPYLNPYANHEEYQHEDENIFKNTLLSPLSTFSIDTDTASYSNMRRFALNGNSIPDGSIRTEELINYFDYDLPHPTDGTPFSVTTEVHSCPWNSEHRLAMINIQGEEMTERNPQNLVFLLDVSGSMYSPNKLPLVKRSMDLLLSSLDERDTISIVTYAGSTQVLASGIRASEKDKIMEIINGLNASGGTNGAGGIQLAYQQAEEFKCDGNNRIILCTDGDFNIGISDNNELKKMISEKRSNNIFLSVLGFGMGNYKDSRMEMLADNGDGGYYYIDNLREAKKVLSDEMTSTLYTIAKDVKIQVEFNPARVSSYRLIGYENRVLQNEEFADDTVDAGELGAGASVTAFYELIPSDRADISAEDGTELRYQTAAYRNTSELMDVKLRYKLPEGGDSILKEYPVTDDTPETAASENFRFASGVAELGMLLNNSEYLGSSSYDSVIELTRGAMGKDPLGFRHELVQLVDILRFTNRSTR